MTRAVMVIDGIPRMRNLYLSSPTIYDESIVVGTGGITAGTHITLPSSKTYFGLELEVYINGTAMEDGSDYTYVGVDAKTQVDVAYDLMAGDVLRFRINSDPSNQSLIYNTGLTIGVGGVATGTAITLPAGKTYAGNELTVVVNGVFQELNRDFEWVGVGDLKTQVSFTYDLVAGDRIVFRIEA